MILLAMLVASLDWGCVWVLIFAKRGGCIEFEYHRPAKSGSTCNLIYDLLTVIRLVIVRVTTPDLRSSSDEEAPREEKGHTCATIIKIISLLHLSDIIITTTLGLNTPCTYVNDDDYYYDVYMYIIMFFSVP